MATVASSSAILSILKKSMNNSAANEKDGQNLIKTIKQENMDEVSFEEVDSLDTSVSLCCLKVNLQLVDRFRRICQFRRIKNAVH